MTADKRKISRRVIIVVAVVAVVAVVVVVVRELENRLLPQLRKPEEGAARHALVPRQALVRECTHEPWRAITREATRGGGIEDE